MSNNNNNNQNDQQVSVDDDEMSIGYLDNDEGIGEDCGED